MVRRFHCEGKAMHYPQCEACTATIENTFATKEEAIAAWNRAMTRAGLTTEAIVADLRRLGAKYLEQGKPELCAVCDYAARTYARGELMTEES